MKKIICAWAAIASISAVPVMAGSINDAKIEPPIIIADTTASSSSGTAIVVLLGVLVSIPMFVD